jgi:signal transduction histidine kinase
MAAIADRLRRLDPARADALLAAVLFVLAQAECWLSPSVAGQRPETALAAAAMTSVLALRRRAPLLTLTVAVSAITALALTAGLPNAAFLLPAGLLAVYSLGAHAAPDRAVVGLAIALAALPVGAVRTDDPTVTDLTAPALLFAAAWFTGRSLRARRLRSTANERAAAAAERARIARELHDIVAHRVTTMVIQSESGLAVADEPDAARRAFAAIGESGREAVAELRRLLGLLRAGDDGAGTAPQPGLAQLDRLVEDTRAAGLEVEAHVDGALGGLPPGVDLAAYRILQEALTNALRHGRAPTALSVRRGGAELAVEVRNALSGQPGAQGGAGQGLAGMRERVRLYGGRLTAGAADGEFVVRATLPLDEAPR